MPDWIRRSDCVIGLENSEGTWKLQEMSKKMATTDLPYRTSTLDALLDNLICQDEVNSAVSTLLTYLFVVLDPLNVCSSSAATVALQLLSEEPSAAERVGPSSREKHPLPKTQLYRAIIRSKISEQHNCFVPKSLCRNFLTETSLVVGSDGQICSQ